MFAEHVWVDGWCVTCGASEAGYNATIMAGGESTCLWTDETKPAAVRPEPERRVYASEDFDAIGERMRELETERVDGRSD